MSRRFGPAFFARILVSGIVFSAILAAVMTTLDWRKNPSGIFHSPNGTDWAITGETFFSWFWPTLPAAILLILIAASLITLARRRA